MQTKLLENISSQISMLTVMHPQFQVCLDGICELVTQSHLSGTPTGGSVVGPSGVGKSHLIKIIKKQYLQKSGLLDADSAVISISASTVPNVGSILDRMLQTLGHPPGIRTTRQQDLRQSILMKALLDRKVQLVIVNEFQHLFRGRRNVIANEITDLIKELMDETGIPFFVFGTDDLGDLSQLDLQFATRLPARFQIRPFSRGDEWISFLNAFQTSCNLIDVSIINKLESKIHLTTNGSPRTLKYLLINAATHCVKNSRSKIDVQDLSAAFDSIFGSSAAIRNPFK